MYPARVLYFLYYIKETKKSTLQKFSLYARDITGWSQATLWKNIISSVFKYNISILDYFYFRFFELDSIEKEKYAGTGYMYEYQLKMNPLKKREVLQNKITFLQRFKSYVNRQTATIGELSSQPTLVKTMLTNPSGKLVTKGSMGQVGAEVKVIQTQDFNSNSLIEFMKANNFDLLEEFVVQHPDLMKLSDSGLNTLRLFSQLNNNNEVEFLGARLRITINSTVDNMAAGNIAASVNLKTGIVDGPGVFSDITKEDLYHHPVSGEKIIGFQVPFWSETIEMVKNASLLIPLNKSVGWDVAITAKGPELIEGNHNWCKLLWQLPVKKGLKSMLEPYYMQQD